MFGAGGDLLWACKQRAYVYNPWNISLLNCWVQCIEIYNFLHIFCFGLWCSGSVLGIVTRLRAGRSGVRILVGHETYLYSETSGPVLGPIQLPIQWMPAACSVGVRRSVSEVDDSPPRNVEFKNGWSYTSASRYVPWWPGLGQVDIGGSRCISHFTVETTSRLLQRQRCSLPLRRCRLRIGRDTWCPHVPWFSLYLLNMPPYYLNYDDKPPYYLNYDDNCFFPPRFFTFRHSPIILQLNVWHCVKSVNCVGLLVCSEHHNLKTAFVWVLYSTRPYISI